MPKFEVEESRGGEEKKKKGDWSPARPLRDRLLEEGRAVIPSPKGEASDACWMCDSRSGEPTWPKAVPVPTVPVLLDSCRCLANKALNLLGLEARGEPTLLELLLGMPRPPWVVLLRPAKSCSGRDRRRIFSCGVNTSSRRLVGK